MARELNPEILRERLPDNYRQVLEQAESNVNRAVDDLIGQFKQQLESLAKQLEEGKFSENLQTELNKIDEQWQQALSGLESSAKGIRETANQLKASATAGEDLKKLAGALATDAEGLQTRLNEVRAKVKQVGDLSGKILGSSLRKLVTGGF